jgi:HSP20 family protein
MAMTNLMRPTRWFRPGVSGQVSSGSSALVGTDDPFVRLQDDVNRVFDSFFGGSGWAVDSPLVNGSGLIQPEIDIFETDRAYHLAVELPGVERDDIDLSVDDDALIIRARKQRTSEDVKQDRYHRIERRFGRFERMLTLPADADGENISAELKNGVLEVSIPRLENVDTTGGRRIEIKGG